MHMYSCLQPGVVHDYHSHFTFATQGLSTFDAPRLSLNTLADRELS